MSERAWQVVLIVAGAIVAAVVQALFKSKKEQGMRIGRLEKEHDYQRGYREGVREGRRGRGSREQ